MGSEPYGEKITELTTNDEPIRWGAATADLARAARRERTERLNNIVIGRKREGAVEVKKDRGGLLGS
jgi:hypothetical protein